MSKLGPPIRQLLITLETQAGQRVHESHVPQGDIEPDGGFPAYIFFSQDGIERDETIDEIGKAPNALTYTIECIGPNDDIATAIAEDIMPVDGQRNLLDLDGTESVIFVDEQSSDYVPRGLRTDVGSHVKALVLEIHVIGGCA